MEGDKIKTNILIAGKSGVGKSSLLNYIFGEEVSPTGAGKPVTAEGLHEYSFELKDNDRISFSICDSWGLEPDKADEWHKQIIDKVAEYDKHSINEWFSTIIYCLSADSDRVEDFEISIINDLIAEKNNVNVVITHCKSENDDRAERMKKRIVDDGGFQAAKAHVVLAVHMGHGQLVRLGVAVPRRRGHAGAAGVGQTQRAGDLVVGLACGIVHGAA